MAKIKQQKKNSPKRGTKKLSAIEEELENAAPNEESSHSNDRRKKDKVSHISPKSREISKTKPSTSKKVTKKNKEKIESSLATAKNSKKISVDGATKTKISGKSKSIPSEKELKRKRDETSWFVNMHDPPALPPAPKIPGCTISQISHLEFGEKRGIRSAEYVNAHAGFIELGPGATRSHKRADRRLRFFVLTGAVQLLLAHGKVIDYDGGMIFFIPLGVKYSMQNVGDIPCLMQFQVNC